MSIKELSDDFNLKIKPQLEEILRLLKNQQATNINNNIEDVATMIITELKTIIHECPCNKEILEALNKEPSKDKQIIQKDDHTSKSSSGLRKYSYPNFSVGNEELGTGKNPGSLTWPFGNDLNKSS